MYYIFFVRYQNNFYKTKQSTTIRLEKSKIDDLANKKNSDPYEIRDLIKQAVSADYYNIDILSMCRIN